eukprot:gene8682-1074_t
MEHQSNQQSCEHIPSEDDVLEAIFNPEMPFGSATKEPELHGLDEEALEDAGDEQRLREKEREGVKLAEDGRLEEALEVFNVVINERPNRGSGYNNRAQVYQIKGDKESAMKDLNRAIEECPLTTRVAQQAYAQRAILKRLSDDTDGARKDFEMAGKYGNVWARHEAVKLNPYAALCNQMLRQAVNKLSGNQPSDSRKE